MSDDKLDKKRVLSNKITIYKRIDSPHWHYYFRVNKITFRGTTHLKNFDESEEYCILKYNEIKKTGGKIESQRTFQECVNKFLESKIGNVKKGTIKDYEVKKKFLVEYFKNIDLNAIDEDVCNDYVTWRINYYKDNAKRSSYKYKARGKIVKVHKKISMLQKILQV
jgi:hypothetical protein